MEGLKYRLPYPIIFTAPTAANPWLSRENLLGGFNFVVIKDRNIFVDVNLPREAYQMSMEEIGMFLFGTFFDEDGQKIGSFRIDVGGGVTYLEE